jgi:predicted dehydrogenase
MKQSRKERITRRQFLGRGVAAGTAFAIVPPCYVWGGPKAPSNRITRGVIGTGGQGMGHIRGYPTTLAVCDVDRHRLARAKKRAGGKCDAYTDWRRVIDRKDIDTIHIPTPPHWHGLIAIAAVQAGKDVFSEKPMTHTIEEGRAVIKAVRQYGRVYQANVHGRTRHGGNLKKLVMSGLLGWPLTVVRRGGFKVRQWSGRHNLPPQKVPEHLDYDMWLGPAPVKPYHPHRVHGSFRGYWDYDGGGLTDMGQHYLDPIQYMLGKDDDGPVTIEAYAPWPQHPDAAGSWGWIKFTYGDGTRIIIESGEWGKAHFAGRPFIEGPKGKVWDMGGRKTDPPDLMQKLRSYPNPPRLHGWDHAVRSRDDRHGGKPNAEAAHRSCSLVNLAIIALRVGRTIRWDPVAERVIGDDEANRLVNVPMRAPWHI